MICPLMSSKSYVECVQSRCALWQGEIQISFSGITGDTRMDDTLMWKIHFDKVLSGMGYPGGKIPAMCSLKYKALGGKWYD